jgi:hypothetical protein
MGRTCSTDGENRNIYRIVVKILEERAHWEDQEVGGCEILKWILER